ncbi:hypothetical protein FQR65_LT02757 [Abscondita terminalis]|nr:hypothetical protein FQR65_LT02757 [Abscondita terminalis]
MNFKESDGYSTDGYKHKRPTEKEQEALRRYFWKYIKDTFQVDLPVFIINILKVNGYDNVMALKGFSESDINSIENFAKDVLPNIINIEDQDEIKKYYGFFSKNYTKFCIPPGIKKSLLNIGSELASSKDFKRINEDNPGNSSGNKSSKSIEAARKRKRTILSSIENRESIIAEFNINDARKTLDHIVRKDIGNETSDNLCENNSDCSSHTGCKSKQSCYKWKQIKYSRQERKRRKRESALIDSQNPQSLITAFFPLIRKIETIITKEPEHVIRDFNFISEKLKVSHSKALEMLLNAATKNYNKVKGKRYDEKIKQFSKYLYLIGGCLLYETLYNNLKQNLPSLSTVRKDLQNSFDVYEGKMRFRELKNYLITQKYPLKVFISEDATAITEDDIIFPRERHRKLGNLEFQKYSSNDFQSELLSYDEIEQTIMEAKENAEHVLSDLGIEIENDEWMNISIPNVHDHNKHDELDELKESSSSDVIYENSNEQSNTHLSDVDLGDTTIIEELENVDLNLLDYSDSTNLSSLVEVRNKGKVLRIKKTTLCWFLDNKDSRLSSDRLQRVKGPKQIKDNNKQTIKKKKKKRLESDSDSLEEDHLSPIYDDSEDSETFSDVENISSSKAGDISLAVEKYYAVAYHDTWYIGRILEANEKESKVKFLKFDLDRMIKQKNLEEVMKKKFEKLDKEKRKTNIIIKGGNFEPDNLEKRVQDFLNEKVGVTIKALEAYNLPHNPAITIVKLKNWESKQQIMKNKVKLNGSQIYIENDMTYEERKAQKYVRELAKKEGSAGINYTKKEMIQQEERASTSKN